MCGAPAHTATTAPSAAISSPAGGAVLAENVTVTATASDDFAVTRVEFYDEGSLIGTDDSAPYSVNWSLLLVTRGQHTGVVVTVQ